MEEWERPEETLRNGKTFNVHQELLRADQQYRDTRIFINLQKTNRAGMAAPRRTTRSRKYTEDQARWISQASLAEIEQEYQCDLVRARYLKYYVPALYGFSIR